MTRLETAREEIQRRCNPTGAGLTDVMLGNVRLQRSQLRLYQAKAGAKTWTRRECWWLLIGIGAAIVAVLGVCG